MEKDLFASDVTWRILSYFLENPKREAYPRELERTLKISSGSTSTICKKLEGIHVLEAMKKAKVHFYRLNNENAFVRSLKTCWFLNGLMEYKEIFENEEFQSVVLYGSYASGEFDEKSDIDILVITNMEQKQVRELFKSMEKAMPKELSLTVFTVAQWKELAEKNDRFYKEVLADHIRVYGVPILLG